MLDSVYGKKYSSVVCISKSSTGNEIIKKKVFYIKNCVVSSNERVNAEAKEN